MKRVLILALVAGCTGDTGAGSDTRAAPTPIAPASYELGAAVDSARLRMVDIDADPTGASLPPGGGDAVKGALVFAARCASCHGPKGEGQPPATRLVGRDPRDGFPFGRDPKLVKTVGNYWPYATTVFDYVRRAMPLAAPGSLTPEEVYAVTAWILAENEIIPRDSEMNARTLPAVKMPAAGRFVVDDRKGTTVR